jgi:hypothetical protein
MEGQFGQKIGVSDTENKCNFPKCVAIMCFIGRRDIDKLLRFNARILKAHSTQ